MNLDNGYLSGHCERVRITGLAGYVLDGERFDTDPARPVVDRPGPAPALLQPMSSDSTRILTSVQSRGALPMLGAYVRAYPGRSAAAIGAVLVAGLMDGLGLSMLLSMLSLATRKPDQQPSLPEQVATRVAEFLGLPPSATVLLSLAIVLICLKAVLVLLANRQVGYTVAHIATDLRLALVRAVMAARWRHYLQQSVGRLSNAVATEAQRASEAFQHGAEMAAMLLNSLIYLGIALSISWQAGLAAARGRGAAADPAAEADPGLAPCRPAPDDAAQGAWSRPSAPSSRRPSR